MSERTNKQTNASFQTSYVGVIMLKTLYLADTHYRCKNVSCNTLHMLKERAGKQTDRQTEKLTRPIVGICISESV